MGQHAEADLCSRGSGSYDACMPALTAGRVVRTVVLGAGALLVALVGPDSGAANIAPVAVLVIWCVGLVVASLVAGDVMRAANPFAPVVALPVLG